MYIRVTVIPGARREVVTKVSDTEYTLQVREPAAQNMANKRVVALIARECAVLTTQVRILTGHRSPTKMVCVEV